LRVFFCDRGAAAGVSDTVTGLETSAPSFVLQDWEKILRQE
jgi:hypothetical protein